MGIYNAPHKAKAINTYKYQSVNTASPGELILLLYNEVIRSLKEASSMLAKKDLEGSNRMILKAQEILQELSASLNMEAGGDLALRLLRLYQYVGRTLIRANLKKDEMLLKDALKVMEEIRQGWGDMLVGKTVSKDT